MYRVTRLAPAQMRAWVTLFWQTCALSLAKMQRHVWKLQSRNNDPNHLVIKVKKDKIALHWSLADWSLASDQSTWYPLVREYHDDANIDNAIAVLLSCDIFGCFHSSSPQTRAMFVFEVAMFCTCWTRAMFVFEVQCFASAPAGSAKFWIESPPLCLDSYCTTHFTRWFTEICPGPIFLECSFFIPPQKTRSMSFWRLPWACKYFPVVGQETPASVPQETPASCWWHFLAHGPVESAKRQDKVVIWIFCVFEFIWIIYFIWIFQVRCEREIPDKDFLNTRAAIADEI